MVISIDKSKITTSEKKTHGQLIYPEWKLGVRTQEDPHKER